MSDPRLWSLGLSGAVAVYILAARDLRGRAPAPRLEATVPTGMELAVLDGDRIRTVRSGRRALVGRAPVADVRIDDPRVSRLHARIEMRDDGVYVEDLQSRNGTTVDGQPVLREQRLEPGAEIAIGPATIVYRGVGSWR